MIVDHKTLADLELLPSSDRFGAAFQSLDYTLTPGGRNVLWEFMSEPLSSVRDISHRQVVLRHLIPGIASLDLRELNPLIERVNRYIQLSYLPVPGRAVSRAVLRLRYADMLTHIAEGIHALAELLRLAQQVGDHLEAFPVELVEAHRIAEAIRSCVEWPVHIQLDTAFQKSSGDHASFDRFDARIRGDSSTLTRIRSLIDALHRFDALRSLAIVSSREGWHFPTFVERETPLFDVQGLIHPLVSAAIPNGVTIGSHAQLLYVTGPNMAGKTTFMKACALTVVLAHVGVAVPVRSLTLSLYDRVFAALSVHDSLTRGESFFLAEVRRIKSLIQYVAGGDRVFAVVDEMFKGTNVLDASEATRFVVEGLADIGTSSHMVASHITDFVGELVGNDRIAFVCFDGELDGTTLRFSYRLQTGVSTQRLGMQFLEREGIVGLLSPNAAVKTGRGNA